MDIKRLRMISQQRYVPYNYYQGMPRFKKTPVNPIPLYQGKLVLCHSIII